MDLYDQASVLEEMQREIAVAAARARAPHGESRVNCARCGEEIPLERRRAVPGCTHCFDCQARKERR